MEDFEVYPAGTAAKLKEVLDFLELTCHWAPDPRTVKARDTLRAVVSRTSCADSPSAAA